MIATQNTSEPHPSHIRATSEPYPSHIRKDAAFCLQLEASRLQWSFLLTVDNFSSSAYSWSFFAYSFSFFTYSWSFFAYSGKVYLIRALRDCKQRSLTVSKKAPTVSKKKASPRPKSWRKLREKRLLAPVAHQTEPSQKVSENRKFMGRGISVICAGMCHVTKIQITSCPSKKEFLTLSMSVIYARDVPNHF